MWPDMVELHSVSSEIRGQKKKEERKKEESVVKYMSTNGWPKKECLQSMFKSHQFGVKV